MSLIASVVRLPLGARDSRAVDHLWAAAAMAVVPSALAYLVIEAGGGCHYERVPNIFEWWCLFPATVIMTSLGFLLLVPVALLAARRGAEIGLNGWLVAMVGGGLLAQVVFVSYFFLVLVGDGVNPLTTAETVFMPWPFMAGAVSAATYWVVLAWRVT